MAHVYDVNPDGSCFYRSVFNVLKYYGYLLPVCSYIFQQEIAVEDEFVRNVRKYISHKIINNKDHGHIHNMFVKLSEDDSETYAIILEGMPTWFTRKFPSQPQNEQYFRNTVATSILKMTSWASEIEVIYNLPAKGFKMRKDKLYLLNLGEQHYKYIVNTKVKQCASQKMRNPITRRCVNVDGRVGSRILRYVDRSSN